MLARGQKVTHYSILEELGQGGMGIVYKAWDEHLLREVAIKILPEGSVTGEADRKRFRLEALALSKLSHPNIASVFDFITEGNSDYLVMEYVAGGSLKDKLAQGPLSEEEVVQYGTQLAAALEEAHEKGIIHRDLKPGNIVLTHRGSLKVLDFGLAKRLPSNESDTLDTQSLSGDYSLKGTIPYMAPEQVLGKTVDAKSDIYSAGTVLYEMATGQRPFPENQTPQLIDAILHKTPHPPSALNRSISKSLEKVILKALAKNPLDRHPSSKDLYRDLSQVKSADTVRESGPLPFTGRKRIKTASIAALAIAVVWLAIQFRGAWQDFFGREPVADFSESGNVSGMKNMVVAVLPLVNLEKDPSVAYLGKGISRSLVESLSVLPFLTVFAADTEGSPVPSGEGGSSGIADAAYVVGGSVQRTSERYRISLQLSRSDESLLWKEEYFSVWNELVQLQPQLAGDLIRSLKLALSSREQRQLGAPSTDSNEAYVDCIQARAFLERPDVADNIDRAIRLFQSAIEKDPKYAMAHAGLGDACWAKWEKTKDASWAEKAKKSTEEALTIHPNRSDVRLALANVLNGTGQTDSAIAEIRLVLRQQPNNDHAHRMLGQALEKKALMEESFREYRKAIELRPNFWRNYQALGLALLKSGRYAESISVLKRLTELQPDLSWGYQNLGTAYHKTGDLDQAATNYRRAIQLGTSSSPAAFSNLGTIYYRQQKYAEAVAMYSRALQIREACITLMNLGDAYRHLGRREEAEAHYIRAIELARDTLRIDPSRANDMIVMAHCEARIGRPKEAINHAEQALAISPRHPDILYSKAAIHVMAGDPEKGISELEQALKYGISRKEIEDNEDFAPLKRFPRYRELFNN